MFTKREHIKHMNKGDFLTIRTNVNTFLKTQNKKTPTLLLRSFKASLVDIN
jgi:hypothetical protein